MRRNSISRPARGQFFVLDSNGADLAKNLNWKNRYKRTVGFCAERAVEPGWFQVEHVIFTGLDMKKSINPFTPTHTGDNRRLDAAIILTKRWEPTLERGRREVVSEREDVAVL